MSIWITQSRISGGASLTVCRSVLRTVSYGGTPNGCLDLDQCNAVRCGREIHLSLGVGEHTMRQYSFSLGRNASFKRPDAERPLLAEDAIIRDRLNRSMRRRMSDDLANLIRRACISGHVETAEKLLDALHDLVDRETEQFPHGRRPNVNIIETLAAEISAAKGRKPKV